MYAHPSANFSKVIFANGLLDPIRTFSPSRNLSATVVALNIDRSAHCSDINTPPAPQYPEPPAIPLARAAEISLLTAWLGGTAGE
jgi:hypothetical protein